MSIDYVHVPIYTYVPRFLFAPRNKLNCCFPPVKISSNLVCVYVGGSREEDTQRTHTHSFDVRRFVVMMGMRMEQSFLAPRGFNLKTAVEDTSK